jgi:hypothetical protein
MGASGINNRNGRCGYPFFRHESLISTRASFNNAQRSRVLYCSHMTFPQYSDQERSSADVGTVLAIVLRHPVRMLGLRWNFKTATLSALCRGAVFLAAVCRSHHAGRVEAVLLEALYFAVASGIFGALAQSLRSARPAWITEILLFLVVPVLLQSLEFAVHMLFGTATFRAGLFASAALTALSAAFNLYAMRRGALLIGREGKTFGNDICSLPGLALKFLLAMPASLARFLLRLFPLPASGNQK